jgi:hypothetical protein
VKINDFEGTEAINNVLAFWVSQMSLVPTTMITTTTIISAAQQR